MKTVPSALLKLACVGLGCLALPAMAQAPVNDISTSQRRPYIEETSDSGASTYGAAVVEDERSAVRDYGSTSRDGGASSGSDTGSMYRQFQQLQEEVAALRGQLEEQAYEIQKLKQQHQDDFALLDRRLGGATAPVAAGGTPVATAAVGGGMPTASRPVVAGNSDGKEEYEAAYAKLKGKDYPGATEAFRAFVNQYPDSDYAGNSWFWLGFVHQTQGDIESAGKAFSALVERFPNHSKTEDAKYNLGKIYHQQGKTEEARRMLKEVASGSSKSAPLAKSYLESM